MFEQNKKEPGGLGEQPPGHKSGLGGRIPPRELRRRAEKGVTAQSLREEPTRKVHKKIEFKKIFCKYLIERKC